MIQEKYIKILSEQRTKLLEERKKLNFISRFWFREYTDYLLTDEVNTYERKRKTYAGIEYGDSWEVKKQIQLRMRLENGEIEITKILLP